MNEDFNEAVEGIRRGYEDVTAERTRPGAGFLDELRRTYEIHEEVSQAHRQVRSGHFVPHEDVKAWLLSWGKEHELPVPKCACGQEHDAETLCR